MQKRILYCGNIFYSEALKTARFHQRFNMIIALTYEGRGQWYSISCSCFSRFVSNLSDVKCLSKCSVHAAIFCYHLLLYGGTSSIQHKMDENTGSQIYYILYDSLILIKKIFIQVKALWWTESLVALLLSISM